MNIFKKTILSFVAAAIVGLMSSCVVADHDHGHGHHHGPDDHPHDHHEIIIK
jgi:hypothetical protein